MADPSQPTTGAVEHHSRHLVVMGVSGGGKSTIATLLADELGYVFAEGDDFHSAGNLRKMAAGTPLDDADRAPWLRAIRKWMSQQTQEGRSTVVTCSALRRCYRDVLRRGPGRTVFVHVTPPVERTRERLADRRGHYMPADLLASQLATLEELGPDEDGIVVPATGDPAAVLAAVLARLDLS